MKKLKKLFLFTMILAVLSCTVCFFTACSNDEEKTENVVEHVHNFGEVTYEWSADFLTCTATRTCQNDNSHVESETVNSTSEVTQQKSCTLDELTTYTATFTNSAFSTQTKENVKTADKGHTFSQEIASVTYLKTSANCSDCAVYYKSCSCGEKGTDTFEDEAGGCSGEHNLKHVDEIPATCHSVGYTAGEYCTICEKYISGHEQINMTNNHTWVKDEENSSEATCEEDEIIAYKCSCEGCSATKTETGEKAKGHTVETWTEKSRQAVANSTHCEYDITYTGKCTVCGEDVEYIEYAKECHTFYWAVTTEPTCQADGEKTEYCTCENCHYYTNTNAHNTAIYELPKGADGHNWVVDENDANKYKCSHCNETKTVVSTTENNFSGTNLTSVDEIQLSTANIAMDDDLKSALGGSEVSISAVEKTASEINTDNLSAEDKAKVENAKAIFDFNLTKDGEQQSDLGGEITIRVPYKLQSGDDPDKISVVCVKDDGTIESFVAVYANGYITFKTNHFSIYSVVELTPAEYCEKYGCHTDEYISANNDKFLIVEPTCLIGGYTVCLNCGKVFNYTDALGHSFIETEEKATCIEGGYIIHECETCGTTYTTYTPATGHNYLKESEVVATCTSTGSIVYKCANCGDEFTVTTAKLNHTYIVETIDATCTTAGYTKKTCYCCGAEVILNVVEPLNHKFGGEWIKSENGHYHVCERCGEMGEFHTHNAGADATETTAQICTDCGYVIVPSLGHICSGHLTKVDAKSADCLNNGNSEYYVCECGKWYNDSNAEQLITDHLSVIINALDHDIENYAQQDPTCTEIGYTAGVWCKRCEKWIKGHREIPATGHTITKTITKPTCEEQGYTTYTCSDCDYEEIKNYVDALGHNYVTEEVAPTCTEKGYVKHYCTRCGDEYTTDEVDATGHQSYEWCCDKNNHYQVCYICDEIFNEGTHTPDHEGSATEDYAICCEDCGYVIEQRIAIYTAKFTYLAEYSLYLYKDYTFSGICMFGEYGGTVDGSWTEEDGLFIVTMNGSSEPLQLKKNEDGKTLRALTIEDYEEDAKYISRIESTIEGMTVTIETICYENNTIEMYMVIQDIPPMLSGGGSWIEKDGKIVITVITEDEEGNEESDICNYTVNEDGITLEPYYELPEDYVYYYESSEFNMMIYCVEDGVAYGFALGNKIEGSWDINEKGIISVIIDEEEMLFTAKGNTLIPYEEEKEEPLYEYSYDSDDGYNVIALYKDNSVIVSCYDDDGNIIYSVEDGEWEYQTDGNIIVKANGNTYKFIVKDGKLSLYEEGEDEEIIGYTYSIINNGNVVFYLGSTRDDIANVIKNAKVVINKYSINSRDEETFVSREEVTLSSDMIGDISNIDFNTIDTYVKFPIIYKGQELNLYVNIIPDFSNANLVKTVIIRDENNYSTGETQYRYYETNLYDNGYLTTNVIGESYISYRDYEILINGSDNLIYSNDFVMVESGTYEDKPMYVAYLHGDKEVTTYTLNVAGGLIMNIYVFSDKFAEVHANSSSNKEVFTYQGTKIVSFSADKKSINFYGSTYSIGENNILTISLPTEDPEFIVNYSGSEIYCYDGGIGYFVYNGSVMMQVTWAYKNDNKTYASMSVERDTIEVYKWAIDNKWYMVKEPDFNSAERKNCTIEGDETQYTLFIVNVNEGYLYGGEEFINCSTWESDDNYFVSFYGVDSKNYYLDGTVLREITYYDVKSTSGDSSGWVRLGSDFAFANLSRATNNSMQKFSYTIDGATITFTNDTYTITGEIDTVKKLITYDDGGASDISEKEALKMWQEAFDESKFLNFTSESSYGKQMYDFINGKVYIISYSSEELIILYNGKWYISTNGTTWQETTERGKYYDKAIVISTMTNFKSITPVYKGNGIYYINDGEQIFNIVDGYLTLQTIQDVMECRLYDYGTTEIEIPQSLLNYINGVGGGDTPETDKDVKYTSNFNWNGKGFAVTFYVDYTFTVIVYNEGEQVYEAGANWEYKDGKVCAYFNGDPLYFDIDSESTELIFINPDETDEPETDKEVKYSTTINDEGEYLVLKLYTDKSADLFSGTEVIYSGSWMIEEEIVVVNVVSASRESHTFQFTISEDGALVEYYEKQEGYLYSGVAYVEETEITFYCYEENNACKILCEGTTIDCTWEYYKGNRSKIYISSHFDDFVFTIEGNELVVNDSILDDYSYVGYTDLRDSKIKVFCCDNGVAYYINLANGYPNEGTWEEEDEILTISINGNVFKFTAYNDGTLGVYEEGGDTPETETGVKYIGAINFDDMSASFECYDDGRVVFPNNRDMEFTWAERDGIIVIEMWEGELKFTVGEDGKTLKEYAKYHTVWERLDDNGKRVSLEVLLYETMIAHLSGELDGKNVEIDTLWVEEDGQIIIQDAYSEELTPILYFHVADDGTTLVFGEKIVTPEGDILYTYDGDDNEFVFHYDFYEDKQCIAKAYYNDRLTSELVVPWVINSNKITIIFTAKEETFVINADNRTLSLDVGKEVKYSYTAVEDIKAVKLKLYEDNTALYTCFEATNKYYEIYYGTWSKDGEQIIVNVNDETLYYYINEDGETLTIY